MPTPPDRGRGIGPEENAAVPAGERWSGAPLAQAAEGLPDPRDTAALVAAEAPRDVAEDDVLLTPHASLLDRLWLGARQLAVKALARVGELRPRDLNLSWVTDSLAVGGAFRAQDVRRLQAQGITAVVDLREEAVDDEALLARHGIKLLHLPTPDMHALSQADLDRGVDWTLEQQAAGGKVLVH